MSTVNQRRIRRIRQARERRRSDTVGHPVFRTTAIGPDDYLTVRTWGEIQTASARAADEWVHRKINEQQTAEKEISKPWWRFWI